MTSDQYDQPSGPPTTPTAGYGQAPRRQTVWPAVIGGLCIAYACFTICGNVFTVAWMGLFPDFYDQMNQMSAAGGQGFRNPVAELPLWWVLFTGILGLLLAILLFTGGVRLVKRRASARGLLRIWSWLNICFLAIGVVGGIVLLRLFEGQPAMLAGTVFGLLFGLVPPIFLLIWFSRQKIKDEVAGWA